MYNLRFPLRRFTAVPASFTAASASVDFKKQLVSSWWESLRIEQDAYAFDYHLRRSRLH